MCVEDLIQRDLPYLVNGIFSSCLGIIIGSKIGEFWDRNSDIRHPLHETAKLIVIFLLSGVLCPPTFELIHPYLPDSPITYHSITATVFFVLTAALGTLLSNPNKK